MIQPGFEYKFLVLNANVDGNVESALMAWGKLGWRVTVLNSQPGIHSLVHVIMERVFIPKEVPFVDKPTDAPVGAMAMGG